jgi:hypothetical protein
MTLRYVRSVTVVAIAFGVTVGTASAQIRDGGILPQDQSGVVTVAGCLVRGNQVRGGKEKDYVLANPRRGPIDSVPEKACTADAGGNALVVDNPEKAKMTDAMLGRWVEITGRLERERSTDPDNLRELDVNSARLVPVVPPRVAAAPAPRPAAPAPRPAAPAPIPEAAAPVSAPPPEAPVPTAGQAPVLPQTASPIQSIGLIGLLALAAGLSLRAFRSRQQA